MDHTDQAQLQSDNRFANLLFLFAAMLVVLSLIALALWGLPAIAMVGLAATVAVFFMLIAYAAGW
ncbi:hypothetical protein ACFOMH_11935 [Paracoccus mangrovi]|jgi:fatty acid desaturase|uniref:Uncharacterized protein n=1 Tax=Paracoccus mangrovi TaxID=1715645 RepID=A0ABV7R9A6_9RHOB